MSENHAGLPGSSAPLPAPGLGVKELCKISGEMDGTWEQLFELTIGTFLHRTSDVSPWLVLSPSMKKKDVVVGSIRITVGSSCSGRAWEAHPTSTLAKVLSEGVGAFLSSHSV